VTRSSPRPWCLKDSAVQLQAFAAPRREGIWGEVREEIASGITQQGGIVDEVEGPLGWELRAQVPVATAGRHGRFPGGAVSSAWTARAGSCAG